MSHGGVNDPLQRSRFESQTRRELLGKGSGRERVLASLGPRHPPRRPPMPGIRSRDDPYERSPVYYSFCEENRGRRLRRVGTARLSAKLSANRSQQLAGFQRRVDVPSIMPTVVTVPSPPES